MYSEETDDQKTSPGSNEVHFDSVEWWGQRASNLSSTLFEKGDSDEDVDTPGRDWIMNPSAARQLCQRVIPSHSSRILVVGCGLILME